MDNELQKIANTLVLYDYHMRDNGILTGKMGVVLFMYCYSQYVNSEFYNDLAGEMLDKILKDSNAMSNNFEDGLSGVGWAVNWLMKKGLVDGESNVVLRNVDNNVFSQIFCNPDISILGQAIYLLERLKDNVNGLCFKKQILDVLNVCSTGLQEYKGRISLYHLNSVLRFLIEIERRKVYLNKVKLVKNMLPSVLDKIEQYGLYEISDVVIFKQMMAFLKDGQKEHWDLIDNNRFSDMVIDGEKTVEQYIRIAWLQELYFGQIFTLTPTISEIQSFIDEKQENLMIDDLLFSKGLAGLGYVLLLHK